jgi:hypothetical protein
VLRDVPLPRSMSGKILKRELRSDLKDGDLKDGDLKDGNLKDGSAG